jgi:RimJ/RimL family protein N-acetyltransferase
VVSVGRFSNMVSGHLLSCDDDAQRWLGWSEDVLNVSVPPSLGQTDQSCVIGSASSLLMNFTGLAAASGRVIGNVTLRWTGEVHEIGGAVLKEARGQGFGTELMTAACFMAHRHFGISDLRAACERTNAASMRWLAKSGFTQVPGPACHTLPNGRVIDSVWWANSDTRAKRRCQYAVAEPSRWRRYTSTIWPDLPR